MSADNKYVLGMSKGITPNYVSLLHGINERLNNKQVASNKSAAVAWLQGQL